MFGHLEIVEYILENHKVDVNQENTNKKTPLFIAAINGHIDVVERLINNSTDINLEAREEKDGMTPLLGSCYFGNVEVVELLMKKGADLMAKTNDDTNCLILAAGMQNPGKRNGEGGNGGVIKKLFDLYEKVRPNQVLVYVNIEVLNVKSEIYFAFKVNVSFQM